MNFSVLLPNILPNCGAAQKLLQLELRKHIQAFNPTHARKTCIQKWIPGGLVGGGG